MFIEVADFVRCPADHDRQPCILLPEVMEDRRVVQGRIACPVCRNEYPVRDGVVDFGGRPALDEPDITDAETLQALLGLQSPGGYLVLAGPVARHWETLSALTGARVVAINAPSEVEPGPELSVFRGATIPLNDASVRGVVLSAAHTTARWIAEASRVVLPGQRVVAVGENVEGGDLEQLVVGHGLWVGQR